MASLADLGGEQEIKSQHRETEVMVSSRRGSKENIKDSQGTNIRQVNKFKYLDVTISEGGGSEEAVRARVSAAWGRGDTYPELSATRKCHQRNERSSSTSLSYTSPSVWSRMLDS